MAGGIEVRARGVEEAVRRIEGLAERAADPRGAFERIGREIELAQAAWFSSQGEGSWPDVVEGEGPQPLVATGQLRASLVSSAAVTSDRGELRFGTDVPYARFHQFGTGTMPARPPLVPATPALRQRITETVRRYVVEDQA